MELQQRQMALSEYGSGLIDPMTYYEAAGYENGTEIKKRLIEESVRNLPSVRQKVETLVAQQLGLIDETNEEQAAQEIEQQARPPMMGGQAPGATPADLNTPLTPDTVNPTRIDLAR
jgi:hypothetical protein